MKINRREFVKNAAIAGIGTAAVSSAAMTTEKQQQKKPSTAPSDRLKVGFIGVGNRGGGHIRTTLGMGNVDIVAICDVSERSIETSKRNLARAKAPEPKVYTGSELAFLDMLSKEKLDAVIIATPWEWHSRMAVAAMKAGIYTAVEVPACITVDQAWDLVNTHEQTGVELMFLENGCYGRSEMAILNMVRQNIFGEMLHCRCGYLHDLRGVKFNDGQVYDYIPGHPLKFGKDAFAEAQWRGLHSLRRNGDLYPTHGIGPVAHVLDIHNGNRFTSLSAFATKARGLGKYVADYGGSDHPLKNAQWNCGDIVTSQIKCENGETVLVTHDCNNPRPHVSDSFVQGTKGVWYGDWKSIYIEKLSPKVSQYEPEDEWVKKYDHQYWRQDADKAASTGHGGVDYMVLNDFYTGVKNNRPASIDVYDAAAWSAISELSEMSVARGGEPVDFPDFTRGKWLHFRKDRIFAEDMQFPMVPERYVIY
jgi:hypothetical protein